MQAMSIDQLSGLRGRFPGEHLAMVLDSMLARNTGGQLWRAEDDSALLLWDRGNNVLYLSGERPSPSATADLSALIARQIAPQSLAEGAPFFKARALSAALEDALPALFGALELRPSPSRFLIFPADAAPPRVAAPPPGVTIAPITQALLADAGLAHSADVRGEIAWMWPAEADFYERGFGAIALLDRQILCWCTAEYVGPARCGVGITTAPGYERRGIATATGAALVAEAQRRGLAVCWECGSANIGSRRVAEKLGFLDQGEERFWAGRFGG